MDDLIEIFDNLTITNGISRKVKSNITDKICYLFDCEPNVSTSGYLINRFNQLINNKKIIELRILKKNRISVRFDNGEEFYVDEWEFIEKLITSKIPENKKLGEDFIKAKQIYNERRR